MKLFVYIFILAAMGFGNGAYAGCSDDQIARGCMEQPGGGLSGHCACPHGYFEDSTFYADHARSSCEEETGLPECNPGLSRAIHCCIDSSNIPNVRCGGNYYPVRGNDGHWTCGHITGGSH